MWEEGERDAEERRSGLETAEDNDERLGEEGRTFRRILQV